MNRINFRDIILEGHRDYCDQTQLINYFEREYSKALRDEFYKAEDFFSSLLKEVTRYEKEINNRISARKHEVNLMFENGDTNQQAINDLEKITPQDYEISLYHDTNGLFTGSLYFSEIKQIQEAINKARNSIINNSKKVKELNTIVPKSNEIDRPQKTIIFSSETTINKLYETLKSYFAGQEPELLKALSGEEISIKLHFPHKQNKFVEVIRRAKYNGLITSNNTEIRKWLCLNFEFTHVKGIFKEKRPFNWHTVWDILVKGKGEPQKIERICFENVVWLPYKSKSQLDLEKKSE